ncbi:hypothetical protein IFM89_008457 [Coptis chinensis]|uniref:Uncharacterized protein n=1 Tax=Coptis chinensis TaxID=261450 RepID=A0A835LZP9_9MAGN|nr:hypothetical protein IFM89_008457 [Coptis chinensis]
MGIMFEENQYWRRGKMLGHDAEAYLFMKESDILMELQGCPYIIGHYSDDDNVENGHAYFNVFLEYASLGTLGDRIRERYSDFGLGLPEAEPKWWISISSTNTTYRVAASTEDLKLKDEKKRKIKEDNNEKEVVEEVTEGEAALGEVLRPRTPLVPNDWWLSFGSLHAIYRPKAASKDVQFKVGKRRIIANEVKEVNFATPSFIPCY